MPRHSSTRFRCAGPALRLFLLSVFLTPSAFGQSMWKPFEPEWRMTACTAPPPPSPVPMPMPPGFRRPGSRVGKMPPV
jgi:hypothetical protein